MTHRFNKLASTLTLALALGSSLASAQTLVPLQPVTRSTSSSSSLGDKFVSFDRSTSLQRPGAQAWPAAIAVLIQYGIPVGPTGGDWRQTLAPSDGNLRLGIYDR